MAHKLWVKNLTLFYLSTEGQNDQNNSETIMASQFMGKEFDLPLLRLEYHRLRLTYCFVMVVVMRNNALNGLKKQK